MATLYDKKLSEQQVAQIGGDVMQLQRLSLTYNERQRNRLAVMLPSGLAAAIVLPRGQFLQVGDVLSTADKQLLIIEAQPESLLRAQSTSHIDMVRLVYHLANRHVRAMLTEEAIFIEPDPVLADLMVQLGATVQSVIDVFEPEGGAYAAGHQHHHGSSDLDDNMGRVGEMLSQAAHEQKRHATR